MIARKVALLLKDGNRFRAAHGYVAVENPSFQPDNGENPMLVADAGDVISFLLGKVE